MRAASSREPRSVYRQNDFGVTAGGPVVIPKLYDGRNKTFFFASFEGFRNRVGANDTILSVPTPEMYRGDFSNWVDQNNRQIPIYDPRDHSARIRAAPDLFATRFRTTRSRRALLNASAKQSCPYGQAVTPNRGGSPGHQRVCSQQLHRDRWNTALLPPTNGARRATR